MTTDTLATRLWPAAGSSLVRNIVLAIAGSLLVAGAAQISIPMWPVPMTLQTLAVLGVGAAFGARLGAATLVLYALEGLAGLPFFANGESGLYSSKGLIISSGGYIIGFILAAALVGWLAEKGWAANPLKMMFAALLGAAVLYIPGIAWLAVWAVEVMGVASADAFSTAISWGLTPFLIGDGIKAVVVGLGVGATAKALM